MPTIAVITTVTILLTLLLSFVGLFILMCAFIRRKRKRTQSKILISEIFNDMFFILAYDIVVSNLANNPSTNRPMIMPQQ